MKTANNFNLQEEMVLTKALNNLSKNYRLSGKDLSKIIGLSESSISRIIQGTKFIFPTTKEGEMALLLLRIYRSLNALVGNNHDKAKLWLTSYNEYFKDEPLEAMKNVPGLVAVLNYLDAMRGKL